jgi:flagellar biosynthesis/type III secretory pathway protein FliH
VSGLRRLLTKCYASQRARRYAFRIAKIKHIFENANIFENIFENIFVFVTENTLLCAIKNQNHVFMARNYEPLVQVGFRTKKEVKEKIMEQAQKDDKGISEYLATFFENIFENGQKNAIEAGKTSESTNLSEKMNELYLHLYLSAPRGGETLEELIDGLIKLAKQKKITRVKDW